MEQKGNVVLIENPAQQIVHLGFELAQKDTEIVLLNRLLQVETDKRIRLEDAVFRLNNELLMRKM